METDSPLLVVTGIPAVGKTTFGRWLKESHGFEHMDVERNGGQELDRLGLHDQWDGIFQSDEGAAEFVRCLRLRERASVIDYGFPPHLFEAMARLARNHVPIWWFDGDRSAARQSYLNRAGTSVNVDVFDRQIQSIDQHWSHIERVVDGRILKVLGADCHHTPPEKIFTQILNRDMQFR
jgi:predicted kinase